MVSRSCPDTPTQADTSPRPGELVTASGLCIDPLNLRPDQVRLLDIATSLANTCRFAGHTSSFYSVAQHSVACAQVALERTGDRDLARVALLHDASEAYLLDIPRPLKYGPLFGDRYLQAEQAAQAAVWEAFGITEMAARHADAVKALDDDLLAVERVTLMRTATAPWPGVRPIGEITDADHIEATIRPVPPQAARSSFSWFAVHLALRTGADQ